MIEGSHALKQYTSVAATKQWCKTLHTCMHARGRHFEYELWFLQTTLPVFIFFLTYVTKMLVIKENSRKMWWEIIQYVHVHIIDLTEISWT